MRRRDFVTLLGCTAVAWALAARAQPSMPVIGFLSSGSAARFQHLTAAFRQGLAENGYIEGRNVAIEFRWAEGHYDRLASIAADLVRRRVAVIMASGGAPSAFAAKAATATIPIVFIVVGDPVKSDLVASLNRPGGNLTGVALLTTELIAKRLELLRVLVPGAALMGVMVDPASGGSAAQNLQSVQVAVSQSGQRIQVVNAATPGEIEAAFAALRGSGGGALLVTAEPFYVVERDRIVRLAAEYAIPTVYFEREFVAAGGLASYGTSLIGVYRQAGVYVGRILGGARPADLPVAQPTTFELVINLKTAKALGLAVPTSLLASADEVIE